MHSPHFPVCFRGGNTAENRNVDERKAREREGREKSSRDSPTTARDTHTFRRRPGLLWRLQSCGALAFTESACSGARVRTALGT